MEPQYRRDQQWWDRYYLRLAESVATASKDPSTQVGAVLVNRACRKEFLGYNGFPEGVQDTLERYQDRELKYKLIVHAEVNAILKAGEYARGSALYVVPSFALPNICSDCAKFAIQAGVKEIIGYLPDPNDPRAARWGESIKLSATMFREAGVSWRGVEK